PLAVSLLMLAGGAAYASPRVSVMPTAAIARQPWHLARAVPSPKPAPPVTTVLATSVVDGLRSDLAAIAAADAGRVSISLQELSGPRRTSISLNGNRSFYAASTYKLPLLMAEAQQIASGQVS